jgi:hypothetical protein
MSISKTLTGLSKSSGGRPISDTEMLKWANTTAQRAKPSVRPIRSFKDPAITTGLFFLDLLDAIRPGIVDPALVEAVSENGDPELKKQNGKAFLLYKAISFQETHAILPPSKTCHFNCEKDECFDLPGPRRYS